jgi:hypothetical protein
MFGLFRLFKRWLSAPSAGESDFGRRYGWFVERDGVPVGELDYIRWDSDSQFWHDYRLTWFDPRDAVVGPGPWSDAKLTLRNRRYLEVVIDGFMVSPEHTKGMVGVRWAHVDTKKLRWGYRTKTPSSIRCWACWRIPRTRKSGSARC